MKNHLFFSQRFWKGGLSKKIPLEYELSCIIRKDNISFSEKNMILFFRRKMKDFSQKKYMEIWYFLQMSWKDALSKKSHWNMIFLVLSEKDDISFSRIYDLIIYFLTLNWYVQIFLYHCKLRFLQIKSAQACALPNAGDSIKTNNIIN